ncbi:MAG: hypothetical protein KF807_14310 [Xanthobacteraceae bacterium]|nr:hypothetical protein [Xanthobacteraceae bacterium]
MRLVPWFVLILAAAVVLNPVGLGFIRSTFWSGEQLSRNIAQPFVFAGAGILALLAAIEILVRYWRYR